MSPELIAYAVQFGMGAVSLYVTLRVARRVDRLVAGHNEQAADIARLKQRAGITPTPPFNRLEATDG